VSLKSELEEQPAVLARLLDGDGRRTARELASVFGHGDARYVVIAARGTSDNAARFAQYVWGARNRLTVALATPSLFTAYASPPSLEGAVVVAVSQSGRSPDLVAVLEGARAQGRPTIAITNDPGSALAAAADRVFDLRAGPERAVAATKTYTSQLLAIAMLSAAIEESQESWAALERVPALVAGALDDPRAEDVSLGLAAEDRCAVLARGYNLATAFEWALKLQELCTVAAQPFSTVDFEHGPVAMVEPSFPVLAVLAQGPLASEFRELLGRLRDERGARVVAIAPPGEDLDRNARIHLPGDVEEWLSPIVAAVSAQRFAYHLCLAKGLDPDAPRGLTKVTRTW
jgi:glucosamine--fructose-6-phosphate aminotransferase (isomerizing)